MIRDRLPFYLLGLSLSALLCADGIAATLPAPPTQASPLVRVGQQYLDELKKPEYAVSSCMLTPVFASDGMTVAVTADRVFSAGDVVIAVGGEPIDTTAKKPVSDLLKKHGPNDSIQVKVRRADKEVTVNSTCTDTKPFYDLLLEASFAASKNDAARCADKMTEARHLHASSASAMHLANQCARFAGRMPNVADAAYYEVHREILLENLWSSDALSHIRAAILNAVDTLKKGNQSLLADDLKQQYDQAVAASSSPTPLSANGTR
jgi:hypothetical protein